MRFKETKAASSAPPPGSCSVSISITGLGEKGQMAAAIRPTCHCNHNSLGRSTRSGSGRGSPRLQLQLTDCLAGKLLCFHKAGAGETPLTAVSKERLSGLLTRWIVCFCRIAFRESARVAKLADARDLKSRVPKGTYRFDSDPGHHLTLASAAISVQPHLHGFGSRLGARGRIMAGIMAVLDSGHRLGHPERARPLAD